MFLSCLFFRCLGEACCSIATKRALEVTEGRAAALEASVSDAKDTIIEHKDRATIFENLVQKI